MPVFLSRLFGPLAAFFLTSCSSVFYQPDRVLYNKPEQFKIDYENIFFPSLDETKLHGWYLYSNDKKKAPKGTIIFFHGNAQNLSSHFLNLAWMTKKGYDVFIFDYRGYGLSDGSPNQKNVYKDALAGLYKGYEFFKKRKAERLIFYGQSLGGAILGRALVDFPHYKEGSLVVLDSTFMSYKKIAFDKAVNLWPTFLISPLAFVLFSDEYASTPSIPKIEIPTLVIHGVKDQVVPHKFGQGLYEALTVMEKEMWSIEDGLHTDVFFRHDLIYRQKFLKRLEAL